MIKDKKLLTKKEIALDLGISRATLYRYLKLLNIVTSKHLLNINEVKKIRQQLGFEE